jgi:hypothetical protein
MCCTIISLGILGTCLSSHDEVNAVFVSLLCVGAEPEPLQCAFAWLCALSSREISRHCDTELCVVERQLCEVLVGVRVEDKKRLDHCV